jgi:hypothetical protein
MSKNRISAPGPLPIRVESPKVGEALVVCFLGPYAGLETHFWRGITYACLGDSDCNPGYHRTRKIWKGYAPVQRWDLQSELWHAAVLEITEGAEHLLRGRRLRGELWVWSREGKKRNGMVTGVQEETLPDDQVQACFDLLPVMQRFYHSNAIVLDAKNILPPKSYQVPTAGPRPRCVAESQPELVDPAAAEAERLKVREMLREHMRQNGFSGAKR